MDPVAQVPEAKGACHTSLPHGPQATGEYARDGQSPRSEMSVVMQGVLQQAQEMVSQMAKQMASERESLMGALTGLLQGVMDGRKAPPEGREQAEVLAAMQRQEKQCPPPPAQHGHGMGQYTVGQNQSPPGGSLLLPRPPPAREEIQPDLPGWDRHGNRPERPSPTGLGQSWMDQNHYPRPYHDGNTAADPVDQVPGHRGLDGWQQPAPQYPLGRDMSHTTSHGHGPPPPGRNARSGHLRESEITSEDEFHSLLGSRQPPIRTANVKLPPFTGKEGWPVWFNRFSDVADRHQWDDEQRLDELLPRLQGDAGDFVYAQLSRETRQKYIRLIAELDARFRKVETAKTYGVRFSNRDQKAGESVEEYAAELKRLYDKAHPRRPVQTRSEDLLRRFLDGLSDEQARFQVEFVKEPADVDAAVQEVVMFQETRKGRRSGDWKSKPMVRASHPDNGDEPCHEQQEPEEDKEGEACRAVRVPAAKVKPPFAGHAAPTRALAPGHPKDPGPLVQPGTRDQNPELTQVLSKIGDVLGALVPYVTGQAMSQPGLGMTERQPASQPPGRPWMINSEKPNHRLCFKCHTEGHFARECPNQLSGFLSPSSHGADQMKPDPNEVRLSQLAPGQSHQ